MGYLLLIRLPHDRTEPQFAGHINPFGRTHKCIDGSIAARLRYSIALLILHDFKMSVQKPTGRSSRNICFHVGSLEGRLLPISSTDKYSITESNCFSKFRRFRTRPQDAASQTPTGLALVIF